MGNSLDSYATYCSGDAQKVRRDLGVNFCAAVELSTIARTVDAASLGGGPNNQNSLISLARLTERYLMHKLKKPKKVQKGNWEGKLTDEMIEYAANDAAVALSIYDALRRMCIDRNVSSTMSTFVSEIGPQALDYWKMRQFS